MSRFAILPELGLNRVELYAESEFCIEWCHFQGGHRTKTATYTPNTPSSDPFRRDSLSAFAILPELTLDRVELYAELNFTSNGTIYKVGHRAKLQLVPQIPPPMAHSGGILCPDSLYYLR